MKKIILSIAFLPLITSPMIALAGSPISDVGNAGTHGANLGTAATTTSQQILKTVKDYGLDQVAYMLAQKLGQKMASAAINKATGGASKDNDPNFIKDFGTIMSNIEEQQRDLFTTKLLLNTNPYARGIASQMLQGRGNPLNNFTLGSVLSSGGDWQEVGNNLTAGGKDSLFFYSQLAFPQNVPVGVQMLADNALAKQTNNKKLSESLKITSSGFLPASKCNARISDYKNNVQSVIQNEQQNGAASTTISQNTNVINTNNQQISGAVPQNTAVDPEDPIITEVELDPTVENAQLTNQNIQLTNQITQNSFDTAGNISDLSKDTAGCIEEMIKNPIATTQTLTNEAGKFGMDMTKNIQGWGQIVAGLFVSLFNGFVQKGLSTLNADYGAVKPSNIGGPEQVAAATNGGVTNFASVPANIVDLRSDFEESLIVTEQNITTLNDVEEVLLQVPSRLAILDMMMPGPDFIGLNTRLDKYYDHQTAWLQKNSMIGSDDNRNAYEEHILSMLDREYEISRSEMSRDMNDDTKNIPGAGAMRTAINSFQSRKQALQATKDGLDNASDALSSLRQINVGLKKNIDWLRTNTPADFANLPTIVFTKTEWESLIQSQKDASYAWAKTHSSTGLIPVNPTDALQRDFVIDISWNLWENPETFATAGNWIAEDQGAAFLKEKNVLRAQFSAIADIIPSEWETNKNVQDLQSYKNDIARIDNLIRDADQMRHLIAGDGATGTSWFDQNQGKGPSDLLAYMIENKDTLFKSDDVKSGLTLPNILNSSSSWLEDGCRPDGPHNQPPYQAQYPSAGTGADHKEGYACYGNFGYTYSGITYGSHAFNVWIDETSNQYQSQPHISWPTELYWRSRTLKAIPPPIPDTYNKGWTVQTIADGPSPTSDGGRTRQLFCRLSSVSATYGRFSGYALDHNGKNMYCSSKWYDVSVAESIGLFIVNQLK